MMLSGTVWGKLCDFYGRKAVKYNEYKLQRESLFLHRNVLLKLKCLILCTLFTFYFGALSALSPVFIWLLVLRGLVGFGIGGAPQSVTLYAEFLPSKQRARCVILTNLFWSIGACLEVLLAIILMPTLGWRWLLGFSSLPLLIFALFCAWLPESARFHLASGQPELAMATLKRISKENKVALPKGKLLAVKSDIKRGQISDLISKEHRRTSKLNLFKYN
jgi:MFS family permease